MHYVPQFAKKARTRYHKKNVVSTPLKLASPTQMLDISRFVRRLFQSDLFSQDELLICNGHFQDILKKPEFYTPFHLFCCGGPMDTRPKLQRRG